MKLNHVHLRYAPGLSKGLPKVAIGDGLTFIVGPNASGKSTLARTMRLAFWDVSNPPSIDASLRVTRSSGQVLSTEIQSGHSATNLRQNPMDPSTRKLYKLGLAQLLRDGNQSDQAFAARLQTELHGGVPVAQIRKEIRAGQTHHRAPRTALEKAQAQVRDAEQANRALLSNETDVRRLQQEREKAEVARSTVDAIDTLIRALDVDSEQAELRAELATLPKSLEQVRGDDIGVKRGLEDRLQTACRSRDEQQQALDVLRDDLEHIDSAWKNLAPESVDVGERIRHALAEATSALRDRKDNQSLQNKKLQSAERKVFGGPVERPMDDNTKDDLKSAIDAFRHEESRLQAHEAMRRYFDSVDEDAGLNEATLQQQVDALRQWLRAPQRHSGADSGWRLIVAGLFALTVAAIV